MEKSSDLRIAIETMNVLQPMISLSAERLEGLRTQCATSAEITQQEIRTLEGKLVKLFSRQLVAKRRIPPEILPAEHEHVPSIRLWLQVVGLNANLVNAMCSKSDSLESLKDKPEVEVKSMLQECDASNEEVRRLTKALQHLKRYTEVIRAQEEGGKQGTLSTSSVSDLTDLFWDSWDMTTKAAHMRTAVSHSSGSVSSTSSPRAPPRSTRESRSSVPSEEYMINQIRMGSLSHQNSTVVSSNDNIINVGSGMGAVGGGPNSLHYCSTTPCTPVTTKAPISALTSPVAFSASPGAGSHPDIYYSPSNSSVFSPASISPVDTSSTPPSTPPVMFITNGKGNSNGKRVTTPPPNKKFQASSSSNTSNHSPSPNSNSHGPPSANNLQADNNFPLTKSKSHESQLANRVESSSETNLVSPSLYLLHPYYNYKPMQAIHVRRNSKPDYTTNTNTNVNSNVMKPMISLTASSMDQLPHPVNAGPAPTSVNVNTGASGGPVAPKRRERLPTEPGPQSVSMNVSTSRGHRHWGDPANMPMQSLGDHLNSTSSCSPIKSPPANHNMAVTGSMGSALSNGLGPTDADDRTLQVPKSPRTPTLTRSMGHVISHRFTKMFKVSTCDYCSRQVIIGLKCKECKYKCHRDCEPKVPPSCGLPPEYVDVFIKSLGDESPIANRTSPVNWGRRDNKTNKKLLKREAHKQQASTNMNIIQSPFHKGEGGSSSNTSSCNSSTPSSPALFVTTSTTQHNHLFNFPDVRQQEHATGSNRLQPDSKPNTPNEVRSKPSSPLIHSLINSSGGVDRHALISTVTSNDSDRTVVSTSSNTGSTDSDRTLALRVDSQDSQISEDGENANDRGSRDYGSFGGGPSEDGQMVANYSSNSWPRQNSLSNREWDIPFDELKIGDKIGTGHFGTVYRGNWHGDVAIKVLDHATFYLDNEKTLQQFKQEVAIFRKTRHENLVLFMGACMKPPRLAIVTSLCKGMSLFTHLHLRRDKFNMNKTVLIAQQVTQGMSYLHARGIIHKDLKSKNVFLESGKVVITDFGLFNASRVCKPDGTLSDECLSIPPGWLCYLAPEIMKSLRPCEKTKDVEFPFSKASDIYAFGTIWYELISGEWPYKGHAAETIIWKVGSGIRQPLPPAIFSREIKEILLNCWADNTSDRPDFSQLFKALERLPKKRLARSPSHPVHLSRSAESVF